MGLTSQLGPGNLLHHIPPEQLKKGVMLVGNPHVAGGVLGDGSHRSAGNTAHGNVPIIFQIAEPMQCGAPNSPAIILKKRMWKFARFSVAFIAVGQLRCATLAGNRNLPVGPFVQAATGGEPNTSISIGQDGRDGRIQQALLVSNRCDG